jgi:ABC-type phosphate transport system permease subunit
MAAATALGVVVIPVLFVVLERLLARLRRPARAAAEPVVEGSEERL